jgi:hypothetical protein
VALLVGFVATAAPASGTAGGGESAASAAKKRKVVRACVAYQRARRTLRRVRRASHARRVAGPASRKRRAHRARVRHRKRVKRLQRSCLNARRVPKRLRRPRPGSGPAPGAGVNAAVETGGVRWGLHANRWGRGPEGPSELGRMQPMGVQWLREEFDSRPDQQTDTLYLEAARRGMRILPLLQTGNTLPDDFDDFAQTVSAFAGRYGPGGEFWASHPELHPDLASTHIEIYNEPYGSWYGPVQPARYAALMRHVVPRARQANPRAKFLMAIDRTPSGERHTWIDELYRAEPNLNDYFDAVAMHPYSGNRAPDQPNDPWGFVRIADARNAMESRGAGGKEFWITEVGWSTCPGDAEWCVTEAQQAANMERLAELVRTRYTFVDAVFYYHFVGDERNPSDAEDFFGILHPDFSPKPAFHALRRITGVAG